MSEESIPEDQSGSPKSGKFNKVQSKLHEPTTAYTVQKTVKLKDRDNDDSSVRSVKKITSESHLLSPTAALINGAYKKDDFDEAEAARLAAARNKPVKLSDRLLEPTAANIASRQKLEELKEECPDDIWWEQRSSSKREAVDLASNRYSDVPSKLMEPTTAYVALKTNKYEKSPTGYESMALPKEIDPDSHLLTPTTALERGIYRRDEDPEVPELEISDARWMSMRTGPKDVESRLYEPTAAMRNGMWKPKEFLEAEEEIRMEEEAAARGETAKVSRPSERLLEPTLANENARYNKVIEPDPREQGWKPNSKKQTYSVKPLPGQDESSSISSSMKVKETSAHLLEPTLSNEHAKWKGSSSGFVPWTDKEKDKEIVVGERLLEPTAAQINGKYRKQEATPDPRELAWKPADPKPAKDMFDLNDPPPAFLNTNKKVAAPSEHLLTPTAAIENGKWRGPPEVAAALIDGMSVADSDKPGLVRRLSLKDIKPVTNEHFLTPTTATIYGSKTAKLEEEKSPTDQARKVKEPSARLLTPTANNQFDSWKNRPKPPVPEEVTENIPKVIIPKKVTNNEHFLTPTAATVNASKPVLKRIESFNSTSPKSDSSNRSTSAKRLAKEGSVKNLVKRYSSKSIDLGDDGLAVVAE